eukprot:5785308-Amphidinium_carterae.1
MNPRSSGSVIIFGPMVSSHCSPPSEASRQHVAPQPLSATIGGVRGTGGAQPESRWSHLKSWLKALRSFWSSSNTMGCKLPKATQGESIGNLIWFTSHVRVTGATCEVASIDLCVSKVGALTCYVGRAYGRTSKVSVPQYALWRNSRSSSSNHHWDFRTWSSS